MKKPADKTTQTITAAVLLVLGLLFLWELSGIGMSALRAAAIEKSVVKWEERRASEETEEKTETKNEDSDAKKKETPNPPTPEQMKSMPPEARKRLVDMMKKGMAPSGAPNPSGGPGGGKGVELDEKYKPVLEGNLFGPPSPPPPNPVITAIIGDYSIIDGREVKVGDTLRNGSKVKEIQSNKVVVEKDGKESDLVLFQE